MESKAQGLARYAARLAISPFARALSAGWKPYSRLILVNDQGDWSIDEDMKALSRIAGQLGIRQADRRWTTHSRRQSLFYGSQFFLLSDDWIRSTHRIGVAYFHGKPGTGVREFDELHQRLSRHHDRISRIQVSHSEMRDCMLATGIAPDKVHLIPIAINIDPFPFQTPESKRLARDRFGVPQSAVVVGSFQKDGSGWGEGLEPKLVKGPDIFLDAIRRLHSKVPELLVVLSGPARGYVKAGLDSIGVPYRHFLFERYADVGALFQTLDCYIVSSRQEGGPKAILESMASGVPLVTTRVGQAMDMVSQQRNGFMVDVEDAEGLAFWAEYCLTRPCELTELRTEARKTAEANTYPGQTGLWTRFMDGFVKMGPHQ